MYVILKEPEKLKELEKELEKKLEKELKKLERMSTAGGKKENEI